MKNLNQQILNFDYEQNFKDQDLYVSRSKEYSFKHLNRWRKQEKNFVNIIGENFYGQSHLINICLQKVKGIQITDYQSTNDCLNEIKIQEKIIIKEQLESINEN